MYVCSYVTHVIRDTVLGVSFRKAENKRPFSYLRVWNDMKLCTFGKVSVISWLPERLLTPQERMWSLILGSHLLLMKSWIELTRSSGPKLVNPFPPLHLMAETGTLSGTSFRELKRMENFWNTRWCGIHTSYVFLVCVSLRGLGVRTAMGLDIQTSGTLCHVD
jgi:hypothetical protein